MDSPVTAVSYLERAKALCKTEDRASLIYAALELRCGIEARMQEHASAVRVSKSQAEQWEIKKLGRTLEQAFGLGDSFLWVFLTMDDGRKCQFMYAPVSSTLQEIGKRCGDYLHAIRPERVAAPDFWPELRALVTEGCALLGLACASEILRPTVDTGLHLVLPSGDPRIAIIQDLKSGVPGHFNTATLKPVGPITHYPANEA